MPGPPRGSRARAHPRPFADLSLPIATLPIQSQKRVALSASKSSCFVGAPVRVTAAAPKAAKAVSLTVRADGEERLRLHNLSPLKGSRKKPTRKGRGYGAGQVSI